MPPQEMMPRQHPGPMIPPVPSSDAGPSIELLSGALSVTAVMGKRAVLKVCVGTSQAATPTGPVHYQERPGPMVTQTSGQSGCGTSTSLVLKDGGNTLVQGRMYRTTVEGGVVRLFPTDKVAAPNIPVYQGSVESGTRSAAVPDIALMEKPDRAVVERFPTQSKGKGSDNPAPAKATP